MDERERHDKGMTVRRAVLGDAHVDRTQTRKNTFNTEFQELITRYAWREIWTRPGLPRHTRSLITVAMMVALNRTDEFILHVRAAFNNGVTNVSVRGGSAGYFRLSVGAGKEALLTFGSGSAASNPQLKFIVVR